MGESHDQEVESSGTVAAGCRSCGRPPKWESLVDYLGERWLAVCDCGRLDVFLPDNPGVDADDPVRVFLAGPDRHILPATPPWVRLFLSSVQEPYWTGWRYLPDPCVSCGAVVIFGTQGWPRPGVNGRYLVCLNCGQVTVNYTTLWNGHSETTSGTDWTPACPAVQRLHDCIYRAQPLPVTDERQSPSDDAGTSP